LIFDYQCSQFVRLHVSFAGTVHTGVNFVDKSEHCPTVRFVRVTYVRPTTISAVNETHADTTAEMATIHSQLPPINETPTALTDVISGISPSSLPTAVSSASANRYSSPSGFSYKTLLPAPVKIAMCSGRPAYESLASTLERSRTWLKLVGQSFTQSS